MIKTMIYKILDRFLGSYVQGYVRRNTGIERSIVAIRRYSDEYMRFLDVYRWQGDLGSFESLSFLFHSSQANFGLCLLAFDEAAYLYRLVTTINYGRLAEIGRFKGGSTLLIAAAMHQDSVLDSFDIHAISSTRGESDHEVELDGSTLDSELHDALARYGLESRVNVLVQNSTTVKVRDESYDLVFVDGDHSYHGAKKDYLNWKNGVKKGGQLVFHDAASMRPFSKGSPGLISQMSEIERDYAHQFEKVDAVGTLVHFRRLD